jgi:hypothetical protein
MCRSSGRRGSQEDLVSPFSDTFAAMEYLQVSGQALQSPYRDDTVDTDALQELIAAVANKLEALEQRIAAAEGGY